MKTELSKIETGLELGADRYGLFSIVVPESDTINYVTNPVFFADDPNFAYKAGVDSRDPAHGYDFTNCTGIPKDRPISMYIGGIKVVPTNKNAETSAISYVIPALKTGAFTFSVYYSANTHNRYSLAVYKNGTSIKLAESQKLYGGGINNFQRQYISFENDALQAIEVRLTQHKGEANKLSDFYTDAWQVEDKPYLTMHFTGSPMIPTNEERTGGYEWSGVPHFSESKRTDQAYSSGREVDLSSIGFRLTGVAGLGVMPLNTVINSVASGGGEYDGTTPAERTFTLVGNIYGRDLQELLTKRKNIYDLIRPNGRNVKDQPLTLLFRVWDCKKERMIGQPLYIYCRYVSGLEGALESEYGESISITFKSEDPYIYSAYTKSYDISNPGTYQQLATDTSHISPIFMWRDEDGVWEQLPIRLADPHASPYADLCVVKNILPDGTGGYFVYGNFSRVIYNGVNAVCNGVFRYNHKLKAISLCGTGAGTSGKGVLGGIIKRVIVIPSGDAYFVGDFASAGDVANTKCIAKYSPSKNTWESVSSGIGKLGNVNPFINDIEYGDDQQVYVSGSFASIDGLELDHPIARMDVITKEWTGIPIYRTMYYNATQGVEFVRLFRQRIMPGYYCKPTSGFIAGGLQTFAQPNTRGVVYWDGNETFHTFWKHNGNDHPQNPLIGANKGVINQRTNSLYCATGNNTLHKLDYVQPEYEFSGNGTVYKYPDRPSPSVWKRLNPPFQEAVQFEWDETVNLTSLSKTELKLSQSYLMLSPGFNYGLSPIRSTIIPESKIVPLIWSCNTSRGNESENSFVPWHISAKDYAYTAAFDIDLFTGRGFVAVNPGHVFPQKVDDNIINCITGSDIRIDNNGERTPMYFFVNGPVSLKEVGNKTSEQSIRIDGYRIAEKDAQAFNTLSGFEAQDTHLIDRHILGNSDVNMQLLHGKNIVYTKIEDVKTGETRLQLRFRERYADISKAMEYVGG